MLDLPTDSVLHPRQVVELKDDRAKLEGMLGSAAFIRNQLQDGGANVNKQIKGIDRMLEQAPQPIPAETLDEAVRAEKSLRESWLEGMPTQAEMRRNPPGAVDKNTSWHKRTKTQVSQWKNLRRRLHASGISKHRLADEGDISNIEIFRPAGGSAEMNMDNAQIAQTKTIRLPPAGAGLPAVMSDEQAELLKSANPELHGKMALMSNDQRAEVLGLVDSMLAGQVPDRVKRTKPKGSYNESEIAALRAEAKNLGINTYQKGKEQLRIEIAERTIALTAEKGAA